MRSEKLLQLVEGTADAAFALDGSGLIDAWNSAAKKLFGLSPSEVIGRPCRDPSR